MYSYNQLANYYDLLMDDVDYEAWVKYIINIFGKYNCTPKSILDTACGTGNISIPLSKAGYEVWGVDISEDMLSIAENKTRLEKQKIKYLKQDISSLNVNRKFDAVLCMCDGVNYIIEEDNLSEYFRNVFNLMENNGIFIFDISSYSKLYETLGNNVLYQDKNNIFYIWDNIFNENDSTIEMNITFFVPYNDLYKKFEEFHIQKAYKEEELTELLTDAGFVIRGIYGAFGFEAPAYENDRLFFVAQKNWF